MKLGSILQLGLLTKHYIPQPISTDDVVLSPELLELSESIARNVHEVWAQGRMTEGWTYGEMFCHDSVNYFSQI